MSGAEQGGELRVFTLTTDPANVKRPIAASWRAMVARLRRRGWLTGYYRVIEYTRAGQPHLHCIVRGRYLPQPLLSAWWEQIHGARVGWVQAVGRPSKGRRVWTRREAVWYLVKYMGKDPMARYSASWDWSLRGVARAWGQTWRAARQTPWPLVLAAWGVWMRRVGVWRGARGWPWVGVDRGGILLLKGLDPIRVS